jgi:hypothetical protein
VCVIVRSLYVAISLLTWDYRASQSRASRVSHMSHVIARVHAITVLHTPDHIAPQPLEPEAVCSRVALLRSSPPAWTGSNTDAWAFASSLAVRIGE